MRMPRSQSFLILLVCLSLGFSFIFPLFDRRFFVEGASIGEGIPSTTFSTGGTNYILGSWFQAGSNGNITSISAYMQGYKTWNYSFAVYSYTADNNAGTLLGQTLPTYVSATFNPTWKTVATTTSIPIVNGTKYFLVFYSQRVAGYPYFYYWSENNKGIQKTSGATYPTYPDPMTGETGQNYRYCIYATYTESAAGDAPVSSVDAITPYWNKAAKTITATATDEGSTAGVKNVSLWYRYSSDNVSWGGYKNFGLDTAIPWSWSFTFSNGSGYYQFYSIAKDYEGNTESAPGSADRYCAYDAVLPTSSVNALSFVQGTSPLSITATAADTGGSGLKEVSLWYRKSVNNATWTSYYLISSDTASPWSWSFIPPDNKQYYQFYTIAQDNATNSEAAPGSADRYIFFNARNWSNPLTGYHYAKKITIDHTKVAGNLVNFPVLIDNTSLSFKAHAQPDGDDFCFYNDGNTTKFNHEIENYFWLTGRLIAWVNVTSLSSVTDTVIWLYYGNAYCGSQQNKYGTWDGNYLLVNHMNGATYTALSDSTSNKNNVTGISGTGVSYQQTGLAGYGVTLTGSTYFTLSSTVRDVPPMAVEGWAKPTTLGLGNYWFSNGAEGGYKGFTFDFDSATGKRYMHINNASNSKQVSTNTGTASTGTWYYFGASWTGQAADDASFYVQSAKIAVSPVAYVPGSTINLCIGVNAGSKNYAFRGVLDELRISKVARSDAWLRTSYNTSVSPSTFVTVGGERLTPGLNWNTFGNASDWSTIATGWNSFESLILKSWKNVSTGWNTFGNLSSWVPIGSFQQIDMDSGCGYFTNANPSANYAQEWGEDVGIYATGGSDQRIGQRLNSNYYIYRGCLFFDTSSLPSGITSATLVLWIVDKKVDAGHDFSLVIQDGQPSHPSPVDEDYDKDLYSGDYGSINTTSFIRYDWISISFDSSLINTSGTTKLMVRSSRDIAGTIVAGPTPKEEFVSYSTGGIGANPYLIVYYTPVGWNSFGNLSTWETIDQGWNTFGNLSSWETIDQGWNTFRNTVSWMNVSTGWNTFANQSSYVIIDQGWNAFGNLSSWKTIDQGWTTFGNISSWDDVFNGWNTFRNTPSWMNISVGWNTFRNVSSYILLESGWNSFYNNNWTVFMDYYPRDGDVVDPFGFQFMANISDTNGTLMNLTWELWNTSAWESIGALHNLANGTYYMPPPAPYGLLYNHSYRYRVTLTGTQTRHEDVNFTTLSSPTRWLPMDYSQIPMILLFSSGCFALIIGMLLYKRRRRRR